MEADDCWVSLFGKVLDLTQLMVANKENNSIIKPILGKLYVLCYVGIVVKGITIICKILLAKTYPIGSTQ